MTGMERDNLVRWRPMSGRGHVESFFLKANAPVGGRAFWIKFTLFCPPGGPQAARAETWAIVFAGDSGRHVALKESRPAESAELGFERFQLQFGPARLGPGHTRGELAADGHEIAWDLHFSESPAPFHPYPAEWLYSGPFPATKLLSPYPDVRFHGELRVDGESLAVSGWRGMQGHNWGPRHTERYVWVHCNAFAGDPPDTFFEGLTARVRLGPVLSPPLTIVCLRHRGEDVFFRHPRFWLNRHVEQGRYFWRFEAQDARHRLSGVFEALRDDLVGLRYDNPDRPPTYCLNSKIASGNLLLETRRGARPLALHAPRHAALEIATPDADHGVRMYA